MKEKNTRLSDAQVDAKFADMMKSMAQKQLEAREMFGVTTDEVESEVHRIRQIMKTLVWQKACDEFTVEGFDIRIEGGASYYPIRVEVVLTHSRSENQIQALGRLNTLAESVSDFFRVEKGIGSRVSMVYKVAN